MQRESTWKTASAQEMPRAKPEAVGLSLDERGYLQNRQEAWRQWLAGERPAVQ